MPLAPGYVSTAGALYVWADFIPVIGRPLAREIKIPRGY